MKYIGNKTRLLDFIHNSIIDFGIPLHGVFLDIFGGTGSVGRYFKDKGFKIISNDFMTYSYIHQFVNVTLNTMPKFKLISENGINGALQLLNSLNPKEGYVYENYSPSGKYGRKYFSDENGRKIDSIRDYIEKLKNENKISEIEYLILVCALINAADFVSNISGTYGAYLKIWRSMALKPLILIEPKLIDNNKNNEIHQRDSNQLIKELISDVLYIDPPYNERQYASNFHVLESLAVWDKVELKGKTGQRDYSTKKSLYSLKKEAVNAFEELIEFANTKYIVLSYNNEGIISRDEILRILSKKGKLREYKQEYRRFRTESDNESRQYKKCDDKVTEHLFIVKVGDS